MEKSLAQQGHLTLANLPATLVEHTVQVVRKDSGCLPGLVEREAEYIRYVLERSGQNRTRAAEVLDIDQISLPIMQLSLCMKW